MQANKAIVGRNAFAHEAGIHQDGMLKDRRTYEIMRPEDVGVPRTTLVLGKHSGRHAVAQKCEELGFTLTRFELDRVYREMVALADAQKHVSDAELARIAAGVQAAEVPRPAESTAPRTRPRASRSADRSRLGEAARPWAWAGRVRRTRRSRGIQGADGRLARGLAPPRSSMTSNVLLLPGDGIGPEVVAAARLVLEAAAARFGIDLAFETRPIGGTAIAAGEGPLPRRHACTRRERRDGDAARRGRRPGVRPPAAVAAARGRAPAPAQGARAVREPAPGASSTRPRARRAVQARPRRRHRHPLRPRADRRAVLRRAARVHADGRAAFNTMRYSEAEVVRVARVAFEAARRRRRLVTSVDKANVLETSQLWRRVVTEVARDYPDVRLEHLYVDACAMILALDPRRFDVVLTENLFGDILSDEAGALAGSLGLLPSASLGDGTGLYEPVHGSAPTLAGQDIANPIGAIASAAMLLRHSLRRRGRGARHRGGDRGDAGGGRADHGHRRTRADARTVLGSCRGNCRTSPRIETGPRARQAPRAVSSAP